jgi:hypothetical protein
VEERKREGSGSAMRSERGHGGCLTEQRRLQQVELKSKPALVNDNLSLPLSFNFPHFPLTHSPTQMDAVTGAISNLACIAEAVRASLFPPLLVAPLEWGTLPSFLISLRLTSPRSR